jgi:hypothetical protein
VDDLGVLPEASIITVRRAFFADGERFIETQSVLGPGFIRQFALINAKENP